MKGNFDIYKLPEYLKDGASKVTKKSGEILELSKINIEINSVNNSLKRVYEEMGESLYKKYSTGKEIDASFKDSCKEAHSLNKKKESLRKKILKAKDMCPCKFCGENISKTSSFCPCCGKRLG